MRNYDPCVNRKNEVEIDIFLNVCAEICYASPDDVSTMTEVLAGADVVICAWARQDSIAGLNITSSWRHKLLWLNALFLTNLGLIHSGCLTTWVRFLMKKKKLQEEIRYSGISLTILFNGDVFDYFLPDLKEYQAITTIGDDFDVPY